MRVKNEENTKKIKGMKRRVRKRSDKRIDFNKYGNQNHALIFLSFSKSLATWGRPKREDRTRSISE